MYVFQDPIGIIHALNHANDSDGLCLANNVKLTILMLVTNQAKIQSDNGC